MGAGNVQSLGGPPIFRVVFWWLAFLVLTIAGERLERIASYGRRRSSDGSSRGRGGRPWRRRRGDVVVGAGRPRHGRGPHRVDIVAGSALSDFARIRIEPRPVVYA